jgi:uncharacterized protein with LGFP repeats/surface antigen
VAEGVSRAPYSSYGKGLDLLALGGTPENGVLSTVADGLGTMAGTSVAAAKVTGAASLVWAANPQLSYPQVISLLKSSATDLQAAGWDAETGAGLLNVAKAVKLAQETIPETHDAEELLIPNTWSGDGVVTPSERAVAETFWKNGQSYDWVSYKIQPDDTFSDIALRTMGSADPDYYNWIAEHNGIPNPNLILTGLWIEIPQLIPQWIPTPKWTKDPPATPPTQVINPEPPSDPIIGSTPTIDPVAKKSIDRVYQEHKAKLGNPTSDPVDLGNGFLNQTFEDGYIIWNGWEPIPYFNGIGTPATPTPKNEPLPLYQVGFDSNSTHKTYINTFKRNGGSEKLGFPISHVHRLVDGYLQDFEGGSEGRGAIMKSNANDESYWVGGEIWQKFLDLGGAKTTGYPTNDATPVEGGLDNSGGTVQHFRGGPEGIPSKIWLSKHGAHPTWGAIGTRYENMGGPSSWLGFPTSKEIGLGSGWIQQNFEGGYILWHPQHGLTVYDTKAIEELPSDSGYGSTEDWTVKYWNNPNLSGNPDWTMTQPAGELRFNAGLGAPVGTRGINEDNFSARWETTSDFEGGFYNFISNADDGVRVYVDGVKVVDKWEAAEPWSRRDAYIAIPEGKHNIVVEYFEKGGIAGQTLRWEPSGLLDDWTGDFRPVGYGGNSVHTTYVKTYQRNGAIPKLGYPLNDVHPWYDGYIQDFEGGSQGRGGIMKSNANDESYWVGGEIWQKFLDLGGAKTVGYPTNDATPVEGGLDNSGGTVQHFRGGPEGIPSKIWLSKHGAHPTWGAIGTRYEDMGGPSSWLGFPTSKEIGLGSGWIKQNFEGGYILWHPQHGTTVYDTESLNTLPDSGNSSTSNWHAQYWNNPKLQGSPQWSKYEDMSDLRFHAGLGAPVGTRGIKEDDFGARWITTSYFDGGIYDFINQADDGVRVYIDGELIIDKWQRSAFETKTAFADIDPGYHQVMVEYFENGGAAANSLRWEQANSPEEWAVEYFRGKDLKNANSGGYRGGGTGFINKDWGSGNESGIRIGSDDFSDRWTTTRYFDEPGVYEFNNQSDDGIRVWVDDKLVIDRWHDQGLRSHKSLVSLDKGYHRIRVEHYENKFESGLKLDWQKVAGQPNSPYVAFGPPSGNSNVDWLESWTAEYFNNTNLQGAPVLTRTEGSSLGGLNLNWGVNSPDSKVNADNFSTRWTTHRQLKAGTYKFKVGSDDGVRLLINGENVLEQWHERAFANNEVTVTLPEGLHTLQLEYFELGGDAAAKLDWELMTPGTTVPVDPDLQNAYQDLVQELGASVVGVPIDEAQKDWTTIRWMSNGSLSLPMLTLSAQYQEFRGTDGLGALLQKGDGDVTYVNGKLWAAYKQAGGPEKLGYPVSSQKHLGNGAYELELPDGKLFWAPGMTNPTYYEYAQGTPDTLTIPADAWRGEYFDNRDWSGDPLVVRQDSESNGHLHKDWGLDSPAPGVPKENFSVQWTSQRPFDRGTYRFKGDHDDGFMVDVNHQQPINKLTNKAAKSTGYATFTDGRQYPIKVKHQEYGGAARANLEIEKASDYVVGLDKNNNLSVELPGAFQTHGGYDRVGLPTNDVHLWGNGYVQDFDGGSNGRGILMRRHNTTVFYYVHGTIWDTYWKAGGQNKLGYPITDPFNDGYGNTAQEFENNRITRRPNGETFVGGYVNGYLLPGDFYAVWKKYNLGTPTSDVLTHSSGAKYQYFSHPTLGKVSAVSSQYGTYPLYGGIRGYYVNNTGGLDGPLGAPKSGEYSWGGGTRQDFAGGYILWKNGTAVGYRYDGSLLYPPPSSGGGGSSGGGKTPILSQKGADYFRARPEFYTTGNIFAQSMYGSSLVGGLGYTEGNCTWYAHGRVLELGGNPDALRSMNGNANQWHYQLSNGAHIVSDPQPGDIAQWTRNGQNHVAVVEKVYYENGVKRVILSESHYDTNYDGGAIGTLHRVVDYTASNPDRYIRVPGVQVGSENSDGGNNSQLQSKFEQAKSAAIQRAGGTGVVGNPVGSPQYIQVDNGSGWYQEFKHPNGNRRLLSLQDGSNTAFWVHGDNLREFERWGGYWGALGFPTNDETPFTAAITKTKGVWQGFSGAGGNARIHNGSSPPISSTATWGSIARLYEDMYAANSWLGLPTKAEWHDPDGVTIWAEFEEGRIANNKQTGETVAIGKWEQPKWRTVNYQQKLVREMQKAGIGLGFSPANFAAIGATTWNLSLEDMFNKYRDFIISAAQYYEIDGRAIAGAIQWEYDVNYPSRKRDLYAYVKVALTGSWAPFKGTGWGKVHQTTANKIFEEKGLSMNNQQLAMFLAAAPTAIDLIAQEMRRAAKAYDLYGGVDISYKPGILAHLYNSGEDKMSYKERANPNPQLDTNHRDVNDWPNFNISVTIPMYLPGYGWVPGIVLPFGQEWVEPMGLWVDKKAKAGELDRFKST